LWFTGGSGERASHLQRISLYADNWIIEKSGQDLILEHLKMVKKTLCILQQMQRQRLII
jgi:hypothetical protein